MSTDYRALRALLIALTTEILGGDLTSVIPAGTDLGIGPERSRELFEAWGNYDVMRMWQLVEGWTDGEVSLAIVLTDQAQAAYTTRARLDAVIARGAAAAVEMEKESRERNEARGFVEGEDVADDPWGDEPPAPPTPDCPGGCVCDCEGPF